MISDVLSCYCVVHTEQRIIIILSFLLFYLFFLCDENDEIIIERGESKELVVGRFAPNNARRGQFFFGLIRLSPLVTVKAK